MHACMYVCVSEFLLWPEWGTSGAPVTPEWCPSGASVDPQWDSSEAPVRPEWSPSGTLPPALPPATPTAPTAPIVPTVSTAPTAPPNSRDLISGLPMSVFPRPRFLEFRSSGVSDLLFF